MSLNDTKIRSLKPSAKPFKVSDSHGLYLLVNRGGSRLWCLKYRVNGKEPRFSLGTYPDVSLTDARQQHDGIRKLCIRAGSLTKHTSGQILQLQNKIGPFAVSKCSFFSKKCRFQSGVLLNHCPCFLRHTGNAQTHEIARRNKSRHLRRVTDQSHKRNLRMPGKRQQQPHQLAWHNDPVQC